MDLYCPRCAEPWDNDCFHEEVEARKAAGEKDASYRKVTREFHADGCIALRESHGVSSQCEKAPAGSGAENRAMIAGLAAELMGDDTDGIASMMDDAEFLGML
jgi:hypothetical protein